MFALASKFVTLYMCGYSIKIVYESEIHGVKNRFSFVYIKPIEALPAKLTVRKHLEKKKPPKAQNPTSMHDQNKERNGIKDKEKQQMHCYFQQSNKH